ncbi:hypothetical protein EJ03DRAFT_372352 [Teratosphaeria nubilosa]|uniref:Cupin type-2 domain-containing protein n=1 Tax=Teratosphaeria nubilosa TaxID=161662 RepID=A0A6G1LH28_9PEZI|nr:hypothetical protein EJ03DRAFT_372352 [Teratosphaeria nubilosa]
MCFLCLKGTCNVWANDKARTMEAGDFASVPPGVIHQYQLLGSHSEFIGLIVPGGWEEFFRFIGDSYSGPQWPVEDEVDIFEVLVPPAEGSSGQIRYGASASSRDFRSAVLGG